MSVQERDFVTLSCTLLHLVFKIFKKKNFQIDHKDLIKQFEVFPQQMHTNFENK